MSGLDRQQILSALILLATALFVAGRFPPGSRRRREFRIAALAAFGAAVFWVLIEIGVYLSSGVC